MARFTPDTNRLNYTVSQTGREYQLRLLQRAQAIFSSLLNLLPSNYISAIEGPNYTVELKAVAVELAKIELALEDVDRDRAKGQEEAGDRECRLRLFPPNSTGCRSGKWRPWRGRRR